MELTLGCVLSCKESLKIKHTLYRELMPLVAFLNFDEKIICQMFVTSSNLIFKCMGYKHFLKKIPTLPIKIAFYRMH